MSEPRDATPPTSTPAGTTPRQISRRTLLQVAAGGGLAGAAGLYALYHGLASVTAPPVRVAPPRGGYPEGQYQVASYGVRVVSDQQSGVPIEVPPQWNLVITAKLKRAPTLADQRRLEAALQAVEGAYAYAPSGVFALVAYGMPYFRQYVSAAVFARHLPRMVDSGAPVLLDAVRFASDPATLLLEANDAVFHLRSDNLDSLRDIQRALFEKSGTLAGQRAPAADLTGLFNVTSIRTGFVGAGLPRRMAEQAHLPFAARIPANAPLFMGFTSTQQQGQAREVAVSFDGRPNPLVKPLTTARPGDYFAGGTTLHISHLSEDLEAWYGLDYEQRLVRMFNPGVAARPGAVTVNTFWLNPNPSADDAQQQRLIGHNEAVQRGSRTPEGQALQLRVDFNTMDALDGPAPQPGVHFLSFTPGSQVFHQSRIMMDAVDISQPNGVPAAANGINSFIRATRRQNFLVPPRRHRAFPLLEVQE